MIRKLITILCCATAYVATGGANAQDIDPKLKAAWDYVQKAMPGVSYSVLRDACAEGTLMIYHGSWIEAQNAQIQAFTKRFPCIRVQKFGTTTSELRERYKSELQAGRNIADLMQDSDPGVLDSFAATGLLTEYKISNADAYPAGTKKEGFWYPLRLALSGIAWNTDLVSEGDAKILQDWKGIVDPRWKGRAVVVDPTSGAGIVYVPFYVWDKLYGPTFIEQIGAQRPRVVNGINNAAASLASGDVAVIFNASETGLLPLWQKGAPIRWSLPDPGIGPATGQGIAAKAPHLNAAKLYQEYAFAEEGYDAWYLLGGAPARSGLKDKRQVASEPWYKYPKEFFAFDPADANKQGRDIAERFNKAVGGKR
jgi:iron(III) transport system substrate-binding protein